MIAFTVRGKTFIAIFYSIFDTNEEVKLFQALTVDELREMINLLTPSVNRPEVKGYTYCHTFCGHELKLRIVASVRKAFRPLTRWFKAAVPSDVRIGVERAKNCSFTVS